MNAMTEVQDPLLFTDNAANKVKQLIDEEGNADLKLRVFVSGGGCSGFQYGFTFDEVANEDDTVMNKNGVQLLIDPMSFQYLVGAEIDYQEGSGRLAVRYQEPECDHDLRLRLVLFSIISFSVCIKATGRHAPRGFFVASRMCQGRLQAAEHLDMRQVHCGPAHAVHNRLPGRIRCGPERILPQSALSPLSPSHNPLRSALSEAMSSSR